MIKHAGAENAEVTAEFEDGVARLVVLDDGVGLPGDVDVEDLLQRRQASGHIGLASRRVRIEGLGGRMRLENRPTGGLAAIVEMPARRL
ncbi:ATP-binding protein [Gordonia paraffinivorans]|uniref:ATP-binding protein n=1 Tax=Gordonia paraffinivorans TaxID=175628 RepID=UPI0035E3C44B